MRNINIDIGSFDCSSPGSPFAIVVNMGTTYRVNGEIFVLNYNWNSAMFDDLGLATDVTLTYSIAGAPFQPYTGILPDNANNHFITLPSNEVITFRFEFKVGNGLYCSTIVEVLNSEIVDAP